MQHHQNKQRKGRIRKAIGIMLSTLVVLCYASPQAALLRDLPGTLTMAMGQKTVFQGGFPLSISVREGDVEALSSTDERLGEVTLKAGSEGKSTATISLFGLLPLRDVEIDVQDNLMLYPGGQAVGVALYTSGVLVVGTSDLSGNGGQSPARLAGLKAGDVITKVNDQSLNNIAQLQELVTTTGENPLALTVMRGDSQLRLTLEPKQDKQSGSFRIGAWVRDSTAGVGTLSFYGKVQRQGDTGDPPVTYGALGHAITDTDTQQVLTVSSGQVMLADVVDVRKGKKGVPGELKGSFLRENRVLGTIDMNNQFGIYGDLDTPPTHPLYPDGLPVGRKDAVHTGPATILCTVDTEGMKEYDIEIVEVARQSAPTQRSMIVKVTDPALLEKTGGIVQGMSGSPIIQDGRLIGAVTHVYVNDPTMGYGLFIEWMLAQSGTSPGTSSLDPSLDPGA